MAVKVGNKAPNTLGKDENGNSYSTIRLSREKLFYIFTQKIIPRVVPPQACSLATIILT